MLMAHTDGLFGAVNLRWCCLTGGGGSCNNFYLPYSSIFYHIKLKFMIIYEVII